LFSICIYIYFPSSVNFESFTNFLVQNAQPSSVSTQKNITCADRAGGAPALCSARRRRSRSQERGAVTPAVRPVGHAALAGAPASCLSLAVSSLQLRITSTTTISQPRPPTYAWCEAREGAAYTRSLVSSVPRRACAHQLGPQPCMDSPADVCVQDPGQNLQSGGASSSSRHLTLVHFPCEHTYTTTFPEISRFRNYHEISSATRKT